MAFVNAKGRKISYECTDLIEELKQDIIEFGGDTIIAVWCKDNSGVTVYTNYDFIDDEDPITESEIEDDDEYIQKMSMSALLAAVAASLAAASSSIRVPSEVSA